MLGTYVSKEREKMHLWIITTYIKNAAHHFYFGMRAFYFMVPLVFWLFGTQFLLMGTVIMIAIVYMLDRTPGKTTS